MKVLVHYSEIALKAGHRKYFEDKLVKNIKESAKKQKTKLVEVRQEHKRIICEFDDEKEKIVKTLKYVFGIQCFAIVEEVKKDIASVLEKAREFMSGAKDKIAFDTNRADKNFPLKSPEINAKLGKIAHDLGLKVDYKGASETLYTEITHKIVYMYTEKINGEAGLPVTSSGKVLILLSGGIDSPVAAWSMMRRGCSVDFLHVHPFPGNNQAYESKITEIVRVLNNYQFKAKLYLIPYSIFKKAMMQKIPQPYELVVFKHYIVKLAEKVAKEEGYDAIILGDNLGQVASQTIENIKATSHSVNMLIFRPLLTDHKEEIMALAKRIGTYSLSIEQYKDCCSILALHPSTRTKIEEFEKVLDRIHLDNVLQKSMDEVESFDV